jgi:single-stranded-DNA-specific exonuclease
MRGIVKFNVFDALHRCSDLLSKYGGHPMAGGFSIAESNIPELRRRLNFIAQETLSKSDLVSATRVDMEIPLDMVDLSLIREVDGLAPFGHGNREPVFSSGDVEVVPGSVRMVGKDHLKVRFRTSRGALDAIGFRMGSLVNRLASIKDNPSPIDIAYRVQENKWGGLLAPQISLKSMIIERDLPEDIGEAKDENQDVSFVRSLYRANFTEAASGSSDDKPIVVSSDDRVVSAEHRRRLSRLSQGELIESIRNHLVGDAPYNPAESQAIEYLLSGDSTLALLPPGRSYEVVLQSAAAVKAIRDNQATLVVCPFRAAADSRHSALQEELASLGIGVVRAEGSLSSAGREELERSVSMGEADVILVTSEYLRDNLDRLSGVKSRLGLMVVDGTDTLDGARHLRPRFYKDLSQAAAQLGSPVTLVVADADDGLSRQIMEALRIKRLVVGAHRRNNLMLIDRRGIFGKDSYVADLVGSGEKTMIYLRGHEEVARMARLLCRRHRGMFKEGRIAFYHAGMGAGTKSNLERLFGSGFISTIVSGDDFGEGVRDIRHLVYYHPSFSWDEFFRRSSYVGLDGLPSYIHLIFGEKDVQQGRFLMNQRAPDDETLRSIYKELCRPREGGGAVPLTDHEIARFSGVSTECVGAAVEIFSQIGIIELEGESGQRRIRIKKVEEKRDLKESGRYRECLRDREEFERLSSDIFKMSASELSDLIAGPASAG